MTVYNEEQKFDAKLFVFNFLLYASFSSILVYGLIRQVYFNLPFGDKPAPTFIIILVLILNTVIIILFSKATLVTRITDKAVQYKWKPFKSKYSTIPFSDIQSIRVIKFKFIGWGYRISRKYGVAHVAKGRYGILVTANNKKFLIGTSKPSDVEAFLKQANLIKE